MGRSTNRKPLAFPGGAIPAPGKTMRSTNCVHKGQVTAVWLVTLGMLGRNLTGWAQWVVYVPCCEQGLPASTHQCPHMRLLSLGSALHSSVCRTGTLTRDTGLDALYTTMKIFRPWRIKGKRTVKETQMFEVWTYKNTLCAWMDASRLCWITSYLEVDLTYQSIWVYGTAVRTWYI